MLKIAATYLKSVYGSTNLASLTIDAGPCQDVEAMYNAIQLESNRLNINSALRSAIESVCDANVIVDVAELTSPHSHFNDEQFAEGSALIANRLANAQAKLTIYPPSIVDARQSFGQAMHTLQDFYAHSNWVELGNREPNQAIGTGQVLGKYAPYTMRTCRNCSEQSCAEANILSEIISNQYLTSGYFSISPFAWKPLGKCSHGGTLDMTTQTDATGFGINKDNVKADHGLYHATAAQIALAATVQQLTSLWTYVGNETFSHFLGFASTSLIIVIDTTGSMGPYIELVKQVAIGIVKATQNSNTGFTPSNYILSPFNDPTWGPLTITSDAQELTNAISNLTANGGGDWPELYYHGVNNALQVCETNSIMYTFTDAGAKDFDLRPQVLTRAIELGVQVFSFYIEDAPVSSRRRRSTTAYEILDGSDGKDLTTATGGLTIKLTSALDANATMAFVVRRLSSQQSLLTITMSNPMNSTFSVDANVTRIQIDLTSGSPLSTSIPNSLQLFDPSGVSVQPVLVASTQYFRLYSVGNPVAGRWTFSTSQNHSHTVTITIPTVSNVTQAISCATTLSQRVLVELDDAYVPFLTAPIVNQTDLVLVTSCNNLPASLQSVNIQLVDQLGYTILVLNASNVTTDGFAIIPLAIPNTHYRLLTAVQLTDGSLIQRQSNALISPTVISILINNQPYILIGNSTVNISYTIVNQAQEILMIQMCALDTLELLGSGGVCRNYSIANMSRVNDAISISIETSLEGDTNATTINATTINATSTSITFAVTATDSHNNSLYNYNKIPLYFQPKEMIEITPIENR